jgi:predicted Zn-dependent protease
MTELQRADSIDNASIITQVMMALYWRRNDQLQTAIEYLNEVASMEPTRGIWKVEIANTLAEMGDLPLALQYYQEAVEVEPKNSIFRQYLAWFCAVNNFELDTVGLPSARLALILTPDDPYALDTMGYVMMKMGDLTSAERFLIRAVEVDEMLAISHLHLGQLYLQLEDNHRAFDHLSQATVLAGGDEETELLAHRLLKQYFLIE